MAAREALHTRARRGRLSAPAEGCREPDGQAVTWAPGTVGTVVIHAPGSAWCEVEVVADTGATLGFVSARVESLAVTHPYRPEAETAARSRRARWCVARTLPERLPLAEQAVVQRAKVRDYLLAPGHERGAHKARLWSSAPGYRRADAELLRAVKPADGARVLQLWDESEDLAS